MTKKSNIDILKHELVPKHTKLNQKEKKALLEKYNMTLANLPKISVNDPAIASLNVKGGDIIKIERESLTAGKTVYYRGVTSE
ncbi:MAG: DNA-directed RNA polymerase subunit H [Candidatus Nanoarchaeia archaeon]